MSRNKSNYIEHVKVHNRKINYMKALKALSKSRSENPAYKEIFNSLIYDLKNSEMEQDLS